MFDTMQPVVQSRFDGPPIEALHDPQERALQLLQKQLKPNELAYRRSLLRGATRFFGLDIHKEYVTLCAVDASLDTVVRMTTLSWSWFPAWIEKNLTPEDAVALEVTTNAWDTIDQVSGHCHSVIAVHPPPVRLITAMPATTAAAAKPATGRSQRRVPGTAGAPATGALPSSKLASADTARRTRSATRKSSDTPGSRRIAAPIIA